MMAKMIEPPDVYGDTIFCDDTRMETSGKLIHIGVYHSVMAIHVPFPVQLPSFSFSISLSQRARLYNPNITLRIFLPGDPDDETSDEASIIAQMNEVAPGGGKKVADTNADAFGIPLDQRKFVRNYTNMAFNMLEIKQAGPIKVRADVGENRYQIGSLSVVPAPTPKS
jgi:hypothetical protein